MSMAVFYEQRRGLHALKGSITDDELKNLHEQKKCKAIEKFKKNIEPTACGSPANWIKDLEQIIEVVLLHFGFFKRAKEGLSEVELEKLHKVVKWTVIQVFQKVVITRIDGSPKRWIKDLDELIELLLE
ncbi:unnamed protein product [Enterobius vermicularis]|uniref:Uncharacterized protein n=1 Tax=Enterobius vermicularis TaxID=51028 RepID=A0A0N4VI22_ENTVE|nr:unnamed protein product [Enterobius vermicularis]